MDKKLGNVTDNVVDNSEDNNLKLENKVLYTGTHDCNTIVGWYKSLKLQDKRKIRVLLRSEKCSNFKIHKAMIKYCMKSKAKIVILPLQDVLGLGENARINVPGKIFKENWSWRLKSFKGVERSVGYFWEI